MSSNDGRTALCYAMYGGNLEVVSLLLDIFSVSTDILTVDGKSPLYYACCNGHVDVVRYFIEYIERHGNSLLSHMGCISFHDVCSHPSLVEDTIISAKFSICEILRSRGWKD